MALQGGTALLALLLLGQDPMPAEWKALATAAGAVDPDDRAEARRKLERLAGPSREVLRKAAKDDPDAALIAGLLGDGSARTTLLKSLKDAGSDVRRAAAEALGHCGGESGVSELADALDDEDVATALAAARALARTKRGPRELLKAFEGSAKNERRAMIAAHGLELVEPGSRLTYIRQRLESPSLRELAWAVGTNTPGLIDFLNHQVDTQFKRDAALQAVLEGEDLAPAPRDWLGTLVVRAGILNPADVLGYLKWPASKPTPWAFERALTLRGLRRSCLAHQLVTLLEGKGEANFVDDAEEAHYAALEKLLVEGVGTKAAEGTLEERAAAYRTWWDRARPGMIDAEVPGVIDDGVAWLRRRQSPDGSWTYCLCGNETYGRIKHLEGTTALCGYTLLKMDVPFDDPAVQKAAAFLLSVPVDKVTDDPTYSLSLQAMFLGEFVGKVKSAKGDRKTKHVDASLEPRSLKRIQECVDWLVSARVLLEKGGYEYWAWTYGMPVGTTGSHDHSNTQFALLGLLAGQNAGVKVPLKAWQGAFNHWKQTQYPEGGWYYSPPQEGTPETSKVGSTSMTGAGLSSILIAEAALKREPTETVAKNSESAKRAMAKWEKTYPVPKPARYASMGHVFSIYYDLYSIERAMMLGGFTHIGDQDWYHDGALYILWNQMHNGAWLDITDTCFALLFLKRAFVPVASGGGK